LVLVEISSAAELFEMVKQVTERFVHAFDQRGEGLRGRELAGVLAFP
jgi:hypothetical protein